MANQTFEDMVGKEEAKKYRKREKAWADAIGRAEELADVLVDLFGAVERLQNRKNLTYDDLSEEMTDWNYHTPRKYWDRMYDDLEVAAYNAGEFVDSLK